MSSPPSSETPTAEKSPRLEVITAGTSLPMDPAASGVELRVLVSAACGARGFTTAIATFQEGGVLPYHVHECSEAITVLSGEATVMVEGRKYRVAPLDCIHVPRGIAHCVLNERPEELTVHTAFGSATPQREFVPGPSATRDRGFSNPVSREPEFIRRKAQSDIYELSPGAYFTDLFAHRFGSAGICGGYGRFDPGSSLPCHIHEYDESITIVEGSATCLVKGSRYTLSGLETAFVPTHRPHRFINELNSHMAMIWVYAGDEPDRVILDDDYCSGRITDQ